MLRWLRKHPRLVLEGDADSVGMALYNEDLATRRAFVVRQQLLANGVAPDRIIMAVYGEERAMGGENPLDRRVVLYATKLAPRAPRSIGSARWSRGRRARPW